MFTCLDGIGAYPILWGVIAVCLIAIFALVLTLRSQTFHGRTYYTLTFIATIWILLMVGLESAGSSESCQIGWSKAAWIGHAALPLTWCFFVFSFVGRAKWLKSRWSTVALVLLPSVVFATVVTNPWHHLVYTEATHLPPGANFVNYDHGPAFYTIIYTLYTVVIATLVCIFRAFTRAKRAAWPMLITLAAITLCPIVSNVAYVMFDVTLFGIDPTSFMFTVGILCFTWLLTTNKSMDMATVGKSTLFNMTSEPVFLIDRDRKIVLTNAAAKRCALLIGSETLLQETLATFELQSTNDDVSQVSIGDRCFEPRIQKIESPLDPDGSVMGWSVTFVDVTERVSITSALEKALHEADAANRAKDEFISVINHELRTPLTSLKGGLALALSGRLGDVPDRVQSLLEIAHRNGVRLSRLVDNLLLAQKIDIEALSLESKPVELGALLERSFEENRMFAAERGVTLEVKQADAGATIIGDSFAIRQIVDNLISNAIKFSDKDMAVEGRLRLDGGKVRLSIRNLGAGIPEGMEGQVFGRFEQVKNSSQRATQGSGLGLHISKKLAHQMDGDIYYESTPGVDTVFHVEFGLAKRRQTETDKTVWLNGDRPALPDDRQSVSQPRPR